MLTQLEEKGKVRGLQHPYMVILILLVVIAMSHSLLSGKCQAVPDMLNMQLIIFMCHCFRNNVPSTGLSLRTARKRWVAS